MEIELPEEKVQVIDASYECEIEDIPQLDESVEADDQCYNIEAIRQIRDAKVEIQQDGFNYIIGDGEINGFKAEPTIVETVDENMYNEYASEVISFFCV